MKSLFQRTVCFILFMVCLSACNFSKGVKKDLKTGLSTTYNGFRVEDILLRDENGNIRNSNKIKIGTQIVVTANGIGSFSEKEGNVFPGCQIIVTDKHKKELLNLPDAFSDKTAGMPAAETKALDAQINTGPPLQIGETYHLYVRFFDKLNPENEIVSDLDFVMTN